MKARTSKRDRERLREASLNELAEKIIALGVQFRLDLQRTAAEPTADSRGEVRVASRQHYLSFSRAELRALADELTHVEACSSCLRDDPCPTGIK